MFEYRVRLALGDSFEALSGWDGLRFLNSRDTRQAVKSWAQDATNEQIATLSDAELTRECFVLAWLEELSRARPPIRSPLLSLPKGASRNQVLDLVDQRLVDDVGEMMRNTGRQLQGLRRVPMTFGPSFIGSPDVGGADADLIAGNSLVEIKARKDEVPSRKDLCQIAAYLLLDYDDQYSIRSVGICSGRWSTVKEWDAEDYLAKLAGSVHRVGLTEVRAEFKQALRQAGEGV